MALTILIKFCGFIVPILGTQTCDTIGFSQKKSLKLKKKLIFLRVVHIRKYMKISIFSKMAPTILIKFCGFIVPILETQTCDTIDFSRKIF